MQKQFYNSYIKKFHQSNYNYIVATSGGVDSVVLCHLLKEANLSFVIAHCNFNLRGEESNRDEEFVQSLANELNVPFYIQDFATEQYASENKQGIQLAARELRYKWFTQLQKELQTKEKLFYIATAHHANDAIETSLFNFFRGTGIEGLIGIDAIDYERKIVRPLISFAKNELLQFAQENRISFVEDSSNNSNKYKRNFIRNKVLPLLQEEFPAIEKNLFSNLQRLQEVQEIYATSINSIRNKLLINDKGVYKVAWLLLLKQKPLVTIVWEMFKVYNFTTAQIPEIIKLCNAQNSAFIKSETHRIIKNRNWLEIRELSTTQLTTLVVEEEGTYNMNNNTFSCKFLNDFGTEAAKKLTTNIAWLDAANIQFPIIVRSPKVGDYFYPLGMTKKKKLSRFFIDQKFSAQQKEATLVVESNKKIVWIIGHRINERCKIISNTKKVLEMRWL